MSISTIRRKIRQYCKQINAPKRLMTVRSTATGFVDPHVEIDDSGNHYVSWEKGREHERRTTEELDELLYWLMVNITFQMALDYELHHRVPNQDFRKLLFETQLKLLNKINSDFHKRREEEINDILVDTPYKDIE
ncbi:MAG: Imm63 family immunity protein [Candidatus Hodarchaeota archaeon]